MENLTTSNNTDEIIQASVTAKTQLSEKWTALQAAWERLKNRIVRLFSLYDEQANRQNDNEQQIRERDEKIESLKKEILDTIQQINDLNPQLETMEDAMNNTVRETEIKTMQDLFNQSSSNTNDVSPGLAGGYRYKTPKNRRKTKSKTKTKSKSPSNSKKSKKSRRKSKY
tara:strand:+ start:250 stop:759 length:510 start_codon:yes stop_codon:yes gene_type:complete